jgi:hypothetical protein
MKKNAKKTANSEDSLGPTNSLDDLLFRIRAHLITEGTLSHQQVIRRMGGLGSTANVIARSLSKRRNRVRLSELVEGEERFDKHLNEWTQLSPGRKATLHGLRNRLIRYAREFGLFHEAFAISDEWNEIVAAVRSVQSGPTIVKAAIRMGRRPSQFSDADLDVWGQGRKRENCSYVYVQLAQTRFRAAIRCSGMEGKFPLLDCGPRTGPQYRIRIADLPTKLRDELRGVLECVNKRRQERVQMSH